MSITIEKRGRRIEVRADEYVTGLRETVPGAYLSAGGCWTVPLSIESCKLLRLRFGTRLQVGDQLRRWATGVIAARKYMASISTAADAKLEYLPTEAPALYKAMRKRKYQRVAVRFIADNPATLLADDPGLGKTLEALGGIIEAGVAGPYLIVAPRTAADVVWQSEIERWLPMHHRAVIMPQFRSQRERRLALTRFGPHTWLIINPEMVQTQEWIKCGICGKRTEASYRQKAELDCGHKKNRSTKHIFEHKYPYLFRLEWGAIVIDESHDSLIRGASGKVTQRRRGLDMLRLRSDGLKIAASGTPFNSKPHQLWGTLNWLDPRQYSAFHRWSELYWRKGGYTGFQIGEFMAEREKMLWDSLTAVAIRRTKAEVAKDLPPKVEIGTLLNPHDAESPVGIWLEMKGEQARAYEQMEKLSIAELDSGELNAITSLAELTRLKQFACCYGDILPRDVRVSCKRSQIPHDPCHARYHEETHYKFIPKLPSNKFDWTIDSLEEWGYPTDPLTKVVIVSFYTGILNAFQAGIEKHFKTKPGHPLTTAITGQVSTNDRKRIIDEFNQRDRKTPQIMMLNVKAGGTAITIDSADRMIFLSETRIPDQQKQAEDRIHRVSNPRHCMYYYLRSLGTVDVGTAMINKDMIQDSHRLLDGRRGVAYTRQVLDLSHAQEQSRKNSQRRG